MTARQRSLHSPVFFGLVFSLAIAAYIYTNILPHYLSPQWQPTPEELAAGGVYDRSEEKAVFHGQKAISYEIPEPKDVLETPSNVLGQSDGTNKRIEVDLTNQKVYAFEGDSKVMEFLVSTGKWGRTPTGTFTIAYKTRAQKMSGGSKALGTYYYLPNVQFVQFFGNSEIPWGRGFSFHGTYWHDKFGTPQSHGCVNMRNEDAEKLYYWTQPAMGDKRIMKVTADNPGTPVVIYGVTPTT